MSLEVFVKAISELAEKCPFNGNVTATFTAHAGDVRLKSVMPTVSSQGNVNRTEEKSHVFTPAFTKVVLKDLSYIRLNYGTITVSIDVEDGKLKFYEIGESKKYSASLLNSRINKWHMGEAA